MRNPHGGTIVLTPTVLVAEKDRELRWLGKLEREGNSMLNIDSLLSLW
ncbi:MAG TPA: hypothetical protein VE244_15195 [Nitrososphaeraceae archaeon]|jgi:hypothetical protein|nr:hypothetical protein [Nitrososphaeraceae archaeon]